MFHENHLRSEQLLAEGENTMPTYFPSFLCHFIQDQVTVSSRLEYTENYTRNRA